MNKNKKAVKTPWHAFLVLLAAAAVLSLGCENKASHIRIEKASAQSSPAMLGVASVFMNIANNGGKDALVSARTEIEGTVTELHDMKDGKMVKVERIDVPSNGIVELKPGSLHIMIFNLPKDLKPGSPIRLVLVFEKAGERAVTVAVERNKGHQMDHGSH